ncbi:hypothetical protein D3C86_1481380 [compost metagenome]
MRNVNDRGGQTFRLQLAVQIGDAYPHGGAQLGIEIGQRLIEQEHARFLDERATQRHTLRLSAGKLLRQPVEQRLDFENARDIVDRLFDLRLGDTGDLQAEGEIAAHLHMRIKRIILEYHGDGALAGGQVIDALVTDEDFAAGDFLQPRHHAQRRGFGAAGRADEHHELTILDVEIDAMHGLEAAAIDFFEIFKLNACHFQPLTPPDEIPSMKYRCAAKNTISAGAIVSTDIARMRFHSKASVVSMESLSARLTGYLSTEDR